MNMGMDKDLISSAIEDMGLSIQDLTVLMKGYEKYTESSVGDKKIFIDKVKKIIEEQQ